MMTRQELLLRAAEELKIGQDPFSPTGCAWDLDVLSSDATQLARDLACGARMLAAALDNPHSNLGTVANACGAEGLTARERT